MEHNLTILLQLFERAALLLMCLFVLTRLPRFKEIFVKGAYAPQDLVIVTVIFSLFAIFGTYSGIKVDGSLVNVRIIAIMAAWDSVWSLGRTDYRHYIRGSPFSD